MTFLTIFLTFLELGTIFCLLVVISLSEEGVMFSVVSDRYWCYTKVSRYPVSGLKQFKINMTLWFLGALLARESTSSDSSSCWFLLNMGGICTILEFRSRTNSIYFHVVSLRGFSIL